MQQLDRMLNQPITPTAHTYTRREDLKYDNVAIMWEKIFVLKAVLDAFLGVLLLISASKVGWRPGGLMMAWMRLGDSITTARP